MHFLRTFAFKHETKITSMKRKLKVTREPCLSEHMVYSQYNISAFNSTYDIHYLVLLRVKLFQLLENHSKHTLHNLQQA